MEIDFDGFNTYASSVPIGIVQYSEPGTPKIIVDSQHNMAGVYANTNKMVMVEEIPLVIPFSFASHLA